MWMDHDMMHMVTKMFCKPQPPQAIRQDKNLSSQRWTLTGLQIAKIFFI